MNKKTEPLDIAKLKEATVEASKFESLPFLFPKHPEDGNYFAYRVTPTQEPRQFTSKKGYTYNCVDAVIEEVLNDEEVEEGKKYTIILHDVLFKQITKHTPITGKTFDIMGKGKIKPKKGRPYYNFVALLTKGTLEASVLTRLLPTT